MKREVLFLAVSPVQNIVGQTMFTTGGDWQPSHAPTGGTSFPVIKDDANASADENMGAACDGNVKAMEITINAAQRR